MNYKQQNASPLEMSLAEDQREVLDHIKNAVKQEIERDKSKSFLEDDMSVLDSIVERLIRALLIYNDIRLWLQTKPDLAAELNFDLSYEVPIDDLRMALTAALFIGTFVPTGLAKGGAELFAKREAKRVVELYAKWEGNKRTAAAREKRSTNSRDRDEKLIDYAKTVWDTAKNPRKSVRALAEKVLTNLATKPKLAGLKRELYSAKELEKDPELKKKLYTVQILLAPHVKVWRTEQSRIHQKIAHQK